MKKNKITTLAIAAITSIALGAAGTFAWFFTSQQSNAVSIDTATIALSEVKVNQTTIPQNLLPGENVAINTTSGSNPALVQNKGSRRAIIEIAVNEGDIKGTVGSTVEGNFPGDYTGNEYNHQRLVEVLKVSFSSLDTNATNNANKWKKITNSTTGEVKYYTFLEVNESQALGNINVTLDGELGGGKVSTPGGTPSEARQFEQDSKFSVQFTVRAVQATRAAVVDYFGINDTDLPAGFYEN